MDNEAYSLNYSILSLCFRKGERLMIPLGYGEYQRCFLTDATLKRGSITITEDKVIIAFTKAAESITPITRVGYDLNEKSLVGSDGTRIDLHEVARLHAEYGSRRRDFESVHSHDRRVRHKFAAKQREKERVKQFLHRVSKEVVEKAKRNKEAIVLEKLKGIRLAHQRRNGEGKRIRRRIALWPFRQLQGYIEYKAKWDGVQIEWVSPSYTSRICNVCGFVNRGLKVTEREWLCPRCGCHLDRDLNAAINIERRGKIACLGEVRPGAQGTDEAMKGNETTTAPILRAEVPKAAG